MIAKKKVLRAQSRDQTLLWAGAPVTGPTGKEAEGATECDQGTQDPILWPDKRRAGRRFTRRDALQRDETEELCLELRVVQCVVITEHFRIRWEAVPGLWRPSGAHSMTMVELADGKTAGEQVPRKSHEIPVKVKS